MEIVINVCYGGFGLSNLAIIKIAELQGKKVYFYKQNKYNFRDGKSEYIKVDGLKDNSLFVMAGYKDLGETTNKLWKDDDWFNGGDRTDKNLIKVVKDLGKAASGSCANLKVIKIPDDVNWEISEYDGFETVEEAHRSWN